MLKKSEMQGLSQSIYKNVKDIVNLWNNNKLEWAFIKYESIRDILFNLDLHHEFEELLKERLYYYGYSEVEFEGFIVSYCSYGRYKCEVSTIETNKDYTGR